MEVFKNSLSVQSGGGAQELSVALRILEEISPLHQSLRSAPVLRISWGNKMLK